MTFGVTNPLPVMADLKRLSTGNSYGFAVYNKRSPMMTRHLKTLWKPKIYQLDNTEYHYWSEMEKVLNGINKEEVEY